MSEYEPLARVTRSQMNRRWITRQIEDRRESRERIAELEAVLHQAHDAMMDWHFAHGNPSGLMTPEEKRMGDACRAIQDVLDGEA